MDERFNRLPLASWYNNHDFNAFNTYAALDYTSDQAVQSVVNLLTTGQDKIASNRKNKWQRCH